MNRILKTPISPLLKTTHASVVIVGAFILGLAILGGLLFISSAPFMVMLETTNIPNITPILMAVFGVFVAGYLTLSIVSSRFIQSFAIKKTDYSHLEY